MSAAFLPSPIVRAEHCEWGTNMARVTWSDQLSVGVSSIDDQHRKMVSLLNQMHDGMMAGKGKIALGGILQALIQYTTIHFTHEEDLLLRSDYPDRVAHQKEHADLLRQIQNIRRQYETVGPSAVTIPVMSFLENWTMNHITGADMRYREHLAGKGFK